MTFLSMSDPSFLKGILFVISLRLVIFLFPKRAIRAFSKIGNGKSVSPMLSSFKEAPAKNEVS